MLYDWFECQACEDSDTAFYLYQAAWRLTENQWLKVWELL
jgi:hypothetical protein